MSDLSDDPVLWNGLEEKKIEDKKTTKLQRHHIQPDHAPTCLALSEQCSFGLSPASPVQK